MKRRFLCFTLFLTLTYDQALAQLTVTTRTPARHAAAAPRGASINLTFSQAVTAASAATIGVVSTEGGQRPVVVSVAGSTVTLDPTADFSPGETVTVTVPATVQTAGGTAATPQVHQFTTAATGGAGHFAFWQRLDTLGTSGQMVAVALAEMNGDGNMDLVSVSSTTTLAGQLAVNLGNGSGGFAPPITVMLFDGPTALAVGDLNGDGFSDVVVAGEGNATVPDPCYPFINDGMGGLSPRAPVPAATRLRTLTLGDLDADGDLDLVGGPTQVGNTAVYFNDGNATFTAGSQLTTLTDATAQYLADVDNDGDLDLLHRSVGSTTRLAINDGTGAFATPTSLPFAVALPPSDLNNDGNLDLVSQQLSPASMQVHLGTGTGTFTSRPVVNFVGGGNQAGLRMALADADGDGDSDVVAAFVNSPAKFILARNNGTGAFTTGTAQPMPLPTAFVLRLVPADADGDGDLDLLAPTSADGALLILRNAPPGTTALTEDAWPGALRVWPNPATGSVYLEWPADAPGERPTEVSILDAMGRVVRQQPLADAGTTGIGLRGMPTGLYLVRAGDRQARMVIE